MNENWDIGRDNLDEREDLKINKTNVERTFRTEIDLFTPSCPIEDHSLAANGPECIWCLVSMDLNEDRAFLYAYATMGTEKLFEADEKFEDNENYKMAMQRIREAYERHEDFNEDHE